MEDGSTIFYLGDRLEISIALFGARDVVATLILTNKSIGALDIQFVVLD